MNRRRSSTVVRRDLRRIPSFLIVGTPRSGTTLVQRLACDLPGVRVPPETHFFLKLGPRLASTSFPIGDRELRDMLEEFAALNTSREMPLDIGALMASLGGRCDGPMELFAAIVVHLSGESVVYGEKTPPHLLWWKPLTERLPELKLIISVRDPRAVVASNLRMPFGSASHVLLAERWAADQRLAATALKTLGPERCLVLRYEEIVADPAGARATIASLLGRDAHVIRSAERSPLRLSWEWWKADAEGLIDPSKAQTWRTSLSPNLAKEVAAICRDEMLRWGYEVAPRLQSGLTQVRLRPADQVRRIRFRAGRRRHLRHIEQMGASMRSRNGTDTVRRSVS